MNFTVLGQGTAVPQYSISMEESVHYAQEYFCKNEEERRKLAVLYRMSGVRRRHSVLLQGPEGTAPDVRHGVFPRSTLETPGGPSVGMRMEVYEREAMPLAVRAAMEALDESQVRPGDITHLVTVSCSGFTAPGVDVALIRDLDLAPTVQRTHVGFMGCHGALNGLRVARSFAESVPGTCVLLCAVELCSLHYHYGWNPEQLVANALFSDGAAALIGRSIHGETNGAWRVAGCGSRLIPESEDAMSWRIGDHGFAMTLSVRVPELIATHLRGWMVEWLAEYGLKLEDVKSWAVHPGGPRILSAVAKALTLPEDALDASKVILRDYGNMSSPTVLFIVRRLRRDQAPRPCVALAFGPGLMAEAVLFA